MSASKSSPTANDRFKQSFSTTLWSSLILATIAHFVLLNFFPELEAKSTVSEPNDPVVNMSVRAPLPEPPAPIRRPSSQPGFTPFDLAPEMKNTREVTKALSREYPPLLRDAGIGGTVVVWLYIDEQGQVQRFQVHNPSAHETLNQAALRVVGVAEFSPALNRDRAVAVWVQFPVTFQVR